MSKRAQVIHDLQKLPAAEKAADHHKETTMQDDPNKTGADRKLIALEHEHEVREWAASLGCTEQDLREAAQTVDHSADEVRRFLSHRSKRLSVNNIDGCTHLAKRDDCRCKVIECNKAALQFLVAHE